MWYHLILVLVLSLFLLSICTVELISASKIMRYFTTLTSADEYSQQEPNPILWLLSLYLSRSAFLLSVTDQNKQLPNVKYEFKTLGYSCSM